MDATNSKDINEKPSDHSNMDKFVLENRGSTEDTREDAMTEEELKEKYLKRAAVTSDDVDLIMASRTKKWSIEVPVVPLPIHSTVRPAEISDEDMTHLFMEIKEGEFDKNSARPDLELLTVGKGARKEEPSVYKRKAYQEGLRLYKEARANQNLSAADRRKVKKPKKTATDSLLDKAPIGDTSNGKGIEVPYDRARKVFVLSPTLEDRLMMLVRNDLKKACIVNQGITYYGKFETAYVDNGYQRLWRRLVREHILPKLENEKRIVAIAKRFKASKNKAAKEKVLMVEEIEYSATDSEDEDDDNSRPTSKAKRRAEKRK